MNKLLNKKVKQHYVPKGYLKNWIPVKSKTKPGIWVHNKIENKHYFCTDLNSLGQIRYFYEIDIDQDVLDLLIYKYHKESTLCHMFLKRFSVLNVLNKYKEGRFEHYEKLNIINRNFLESEYENMENIFLKSINEIGRDFKSYILGVKNGQYNLDDLLGFYVFQLFRTKQMRDNLANYLKDLSISRDGVKKKLNESQKNNYIKCSLFIEALNYIERFANNYSIELLINNSDTKYITSSSPSLVLTHNEKDGRYNLSNFEGYVPLSPKVAMILRGDKPCSSDLIFRQVNVETVNKYNKKIVEMTAEQIYSTVNLEA